MKTGVHPFFLLSLVFSSERNESRKLSEFSFPPTLRGSAKQSIQISKFWTACPDELTSDGPLPPRRDGGKKDWIPAYAGTRIQENLSPVKTGVYPSSLLSFQPTSFLFSSFLCYTQNYKEFQKKEFLFFLKKVIIKTMKYSFFFSSLCESLWYIPLFSLSQHHTFHIILLIPMVQSFELEVLEWDMYFYFKRRYNFI